MKRTANIFLIAAFAIALWLPTVDSLLHLDHTTAFNEKRQAASFPAFKFSLPGLQQYVQGLEAYFNDHFGFRKRLIRWHSNCQVAILRTRVSQNVVLGRDGWMFYTLDGTIRGKPFSHQELVQFQHELESRRDWLAQRGIQYLFVVAPDKQSIYPEYLPSDLASSAKDPNPLDQLLDHLKRSSTVPILDLRPALREAKRIAPTYFRTDSHWNDFGGFIACSEIAKALQLPANKASSLDSFELKRAPTQGRDLAELLGVQATDEAVRLTPKANLPPLIEMVQNPQFVCPTFFTTNTTASGSVLVFRDSFGTALKPFLGYYFAQASYFWTFGNFDRKAVEQAQPTVVITELVERHLNQRKAESPASP